MTAAELIQLLGQPVVLVVVVVVALVLIAKWSPWNRFKIGNVEAERDSPSKPFVTRADEAAMDARAVKIALDQYAEVATALDALLSSDPAVLATASREWFSLLATKLATVLKEERDALFRVAIWLDDPAVPEYFICIGHGLFSRTDRNMGTLERGWTIGGRAFDSANMAYYCRDTASDPNFKPRHSIPPSFKSVYGQALGTLTSRWGVMTVDARKTNAFDDDAKWLIRRFGELASIGAIVWDVRASLSVRTDRTVAINERL